MSGSTAPTEPASRGRVWLYAIAFVLLLVAGWLQVKGNLSSNMRQVRWSIGFSVAAAVVAVASVVVPGRRRRSTTPSKPAAPTAVGDGSGATAPNPTSDPGREPPAATAKEPMTATAKEHPTPEVEQPAKTEVDESQEAEPGESGGRPPSAP